MPSVPQQEKQTLRDGLDACEGCHVDILLKDIQTVAGDAQRLKDWTGLAKHVIEETGR